MMRVFFARRYLVVLKEEARIRFLREERVAKALEALRWRRYEDALYEAAACLRLDSTCLEGFRVRGHVHYGKKQFSEAILEYNTVLSMDKVRMPCTRGTPF
jgi:transposase InsO family protein